MSKVIAEYIADIDGEAVAPGRLSDTYMLLVEQVHQARDVFDQALTLLDVAQNIGAAGNLYAEDELKAAQADLEARFAYLEDKLHTELVEDLDLTKDV